MSVRRALAVIALAGTVGCAATMWWGGKSATLRIGMSQQQVRALLGPPQQIMVQRAQGAIIETWNYLDQTIVFSNGLVQSWIAQP